MQAGGWQAAGLGLWLAGWPGESANGIRAHLWPLKKHCRHQPGGLDSCSLGACRLAAAGLAGWLAGAGWLTCSVTRSTLGEVGG